MNWWNKNLNPLHQAMYKTILFWCKFISSQLTQSPFHLSSLYRLIYFKLILCVFFPTVRISMYSVCKVHFPSLSLSLKIRNFFLLLFQLENSLMKILFIFYGCIYSRPTCTCIYILSSQRTHNIMPKFIL